MPTLLHLDASPRHASTSCALSHQFVAGFVQRHPGTTVIHHNTTNEAMPFVTEDIINASFTPAEARTPEMKQALSLSDKLTDELISADTVVFGAPLWNFGVPASLKAWIDLVVRPGLTFNYGPQGPTGLLTGKKVYLFTSSGADYSEGSPYHALDMEAPYLRNILRFIGLTDFTSVVAVNQARGPEQAHAGLASAKAELQALLG